MKIKHFISVAFLLFAGFLIQSCEEEQMVEKPFVRIISVSPKNIIAKDTVTFIIETNARNKVFYSGFINSDFSNSKNINVADFPIDTIFNRYKRDDVGLVFSNDTIKTIAYRRKGIYNAVFVVSNRDDFGLDIQTAIDSVKVVVN